MIILDNNTQENQSIKADIKISHFKSHSEYSKQLDFETFGDNLFLSNPKNITVQSYCYVMNPLGGKNRALKDNADFPLIVYIDIDFKTERQRTTFKNDIKKFGITKDELMIKLSQDKNIWISGNSRGGEGIHIYSIVFHKWAFENKFQDYGTIHKDNSNEFLKYLKDNYGLIFYHNDEVDYIDDASINNMVLKSFGCLDNKYSNVNLDCNVFINENKLKVVDKIYDKNIETLSTENIDYIEPQKFMHYDPVIMGNAKFGDSNTRLLFYKKYKKYYKGDGKELLKGLESLGNFNDYLDKLNMNYSIKITDWSKELEKLIEDFDYSIEDYTEEKNNIPKSVYDKLPIILQDLTKDFTDEKKDVILLSSLNCLGYYFSNVKHTYFYNSEQYNNFYLFVIANSSAGKSVMNNSKKLLYDIDKYHREKFNLEMINYNLQVKKTTAPPIQITVVCGGDATRQGLFKHMQSNNGKLVMFDTEADSLVNQKGDYDYSTLIRKGLQNESFTKLLAGSNAMYIDKPKINICVSGTKNQILNVMGTDGAQNGTFNRFIFYTWDTEPTIEDPHIKIQEGTFENYSKLLFDFYMDNLFLDGLMQFEFTEEQEKIFLIELNKVHKKYVSIEDDSVSGIVKRHFLIVKKLCITIAGLRLFDEYKKNIEDPYGEYKKYDFSTLRISNEDLLNIIELIKVVIQHSMDLFRKFTPVDDNTPQTSWKMDMFNKLPDIFTRKDAVSIGLKFNRSLRTIDRFIKNKDNFDYDNKIYKKKRQELR